MTFDVGSKSQAVAVRVGDKEFPGAPRRARQPIGRLNASRFKLGPALVSAFDNEVHRSADLAVAGMLGEEDRLPIAGQLHEYRKAGFKPMLPINGKSQAIHIEVEALRGVCDSELRNDGLLQGFLLHRTSGCPIHRSGIQFFPLIKPFMSQSEHI